MRLLDVYRKKQVIIQTRILDEDYLYLMQWQWNFQRSSNTDYVRRDRLNNHLRDNLRIATRV